MTVRTRLEFKPTVDGDEAELSMFYQDQYHYEIAIVRRNRQRHLIVRRRIGDLIAIVAEQLAPPNPIELLVKADKLTYQIGYELNGQPTILATGATQHLSCKAAPVAFTGVYFAMYTTGNGKAASTTAYFDWFDYLSG